MRKNLSAIVKEWGGNVTDFQRYTEEMEQFVKSALYKENFDNVLNYIRSSSCSVSSRSIERRFSLSGAQVRKLIGHMRDEAFPIASSQDGYCFAKKPEDLHGTLNHLRERSMKMLFRISKMEKAFITLQQSDLFGGNND